MEDNSSNHTQAYKSDYNEGVTNTNETIMLSSHKNKQREMFSDIDYKFLRDIAYFRYGSISDCGAVMGMSRSQASTILNGLAFQKTEELINRIANALKLSPFYLGRFFAIQESKLNNGEGNTNAAG